MTCLLLVLLSFPPAHFHTLNITFLCNFHTPNNNQMANSFTQNVLVTQLA